MSWQTEIHNEIRTYLLDVGSNPDEVLDNCGSSYEQFLLHGQLACNQDHTKKAIRSFEESLTTIEEPYHALCALGRIYLVQGNYAKARMYIEKATELRTDEFKLLLTYLFILLKLKDKSQTVSMLNEWIRTTVFQHASRLGVSVEGSENFWTMGDDGNKPWLRSFSSDVQQAYQSRRYSRVQNVLPEACFALMKQEHLAAQSANSMLPEAALKRQCSSDLPVSVLANFQLSLLVSRIIERDVIPTYSFGIHYLPGGFIKPHVDRAQNELSMSLNLSITPEGGRSPLGAGEGENARSYDLKPNDAIFYRGCEVVHFREPVPESHTVDQMIFGFRTIHKNHCHCN